jgi:hypothetical protein
MKPRTKFLLSLTIIGSLCGGAVVHTTSFPKRAGSGVAAEKTPEREALADALREHMRHQTVGIGQRQAVRDGASWALIDFITSECRDAGFEPEVHEYQADGRTHQNIIAEKPGRTNDILLIGAHYDAYGRSPSAAASASGIAALIEVLKRVSDTPTDRTLRFAFFSTNEAPYRGTVDMGSRQYAKLCKERNDPLREVLILDSFAHFSSQTVAQNFYFPWNLVFPKTGDFVAVVGDIGQRKLVERTLAAWSRASDVPARGLAIASWLARIRGGDQDAFTAEGFHAVLLTDTGVNRFEDIRSRSDTYDRVDYHGFACAVEGLGETVLELAGR